MYTTAHNLQSDLAYEKVNPVSVADDCLENQDGRINVTIVISEYLNQNSFYPNKVTT